MNVSISHGGRKAHKDASGGAGTKLPREVVQMAKQMGLDMSEMGEEAEAMWAKLNNLAQTDTEQYDNFIKEQMEEQEEAEDNPSRSFTPTAAFVVKTKFAPSSGTQIKTADNKFASGKIFVNVTSHDGIQRPLEPSGTPVVENRPHMDNMQIPLVVGLIRQTLDNSGEKVSASSERSKRERSEAHASPTWRQAEPTIKLASFCSLPLRSSGPGVCVAVGVSLVPITHARASKYPIKPRRSNHASPLFAPIYKLWVCVAHTRR